jgi:hypothetical protein
VEDTLEAIRQAEIFWISTVVVGYKVAGPHIHIHPQPGEFREMPIAVTDHAAERFRQRVRGSLDERTEIITRVARAHAAGRTSPGERGTVLVRDCRDPSLVFVCRQERGELVVISLWQEGEEAAVPKVFTDALRRDDHRT